MLILAVIILKKIGLFCGFGYLSRKMKMVVTVDNEISAKIAVKCTDIVRFIYANMEIKPYIGKINTA